MIVKSLEEIAIMKQAGQIVASTLATLASKVKPGVTTGELDQIVVREFRKKGATPSFKGYRGYPATLCVSVNDEVVHGIPGKRVLQEGDVVSLDLGSIYHGYQGDAAITVGVGRISRQAQELIDVTREALAVGISAAVEGSRVGDVSWAVQSFVETRGYSVVREYAGHGIGRAMHEEPQVPNFGQPGRGALLRDGMVLALEPMVNIGGWRTKTLDDGWTVCTLDGSLSAHFEHTVAIRASGPEILTGLDGMEIV
ncbi:MAG: type I methionyl aminopeptidase [Dehalococcoidia bacterium]|nr:type I methionyl aminopeptidase [Dehalococcoidia bacterium]